MEAVAEVDGFDLQNFTPMYCELNSFASVREFCDKLDEFRMSKAIDRLICNAGVYQPSLPYAKWSMDGHEQTMQINYLSHFLMISKLMPALMQSQVGARVIMVGSVTGNDNTVGGGGVYPIADLHELDGFEHGFQKPIAMADGYGFIGAKAYKDSKLCLMMMANFLHTKYNKLTGVAFSSMYPGCIAESPLFREKRPWFRKYFPIFMKFITGELGCGLSCAHHVTWQREQYISTKVPFNFPYPHRWLCGRTRGRTTVVSSRTRPALQKVGCVLVLERWSS